MKHRHDALWLLAIVIAATGVTGTSSAQTSTWNVGDVFLAVGDGSYHPVLFTIWNRIPAFGC